MWDRVEVGGKLRLPSLPRRRQLTIVSCPMRSWTPDRTGHDVEVHLGMTLRLTWAWRAAHLHDVEAHPGVKLSPAWT